MSALSADLEEKLVAAAEKLSTYTAERNASPEYPLNAFEIALTMGLTLVLAEAIRLLAKRRVWRFRLAPSAHAVTMASMHLAVFQLFETTCIATWEAAKAANTPPVTDVQE